MVAALVAAGCIAPTPNEVPRESERDPTPVVGDVGCPGHGETPTTGAQQSGVSNQPGAFSYSGQAAGKTGTEVYLWQNPSNGAYVQWGGQSAVGTFTLVIEDTCGNELYRKGFGGMQQGGGQEATARGAPGEWVIKLEFAAFTGQMGLNVMSG